MYKSLGRRLLGQRGLYHNSKDTEKRGSEHNGTRVKVGTAEQRKGIGLGRRKGFSTI